MSEKMTKFHTDFGRQLAALARQSGGAGTAVLSAEQRATVGRLASLSGATFDVAFKQTVDDGHKKELAMYRDEVGRVVSPKLRDLVERRVAKLQETVAQTEEPAAKPPKHDW
jgi:predicted outer membrane protein